MILDAPTFVIIGAQKAGTTSLYHYLRQHPAVFMSAVKEPRFFSHLAKVDAGVARPGDKAVQTLDAYRRLFAGATAPAIGEASVAYLDIPGTAEIMKQYLPHAKVIAVLRNPADRAYSQYLMRVRKGAEQASFEEALAEGRYLHGGFYYKNLVPFYKAYGTEQIGIYLYRDLCQDPQSLLQHLFRFLGVDDAFLPDVTVRHNVGGRPRNRWISTLFSSRRINAALKQTAPSWLVRFGTAVKRLNYSYAPLPEPVRTRLTTLYEADILALETLIDRDLHCWMKHPGTARTP